ncbi:MAG: DUF4834 domain-containing protein [Salinimicrobium sp.]
MQEASFYEVLRVILIILLIYFGLKLIFRWFGPIVLKWFLRRMGKKFGQTFSNFDPNPKREKEGEITIEKKPKNPRKSNNDVGEYVDYEEID